MDGTASGKYYRKIMGTDSNAFKGYFEKHWLKYLDNFPIPHKNAAQLHIGNRLRPCLVCWGYALSTSCVEELNFEEILDIAIGIELVHKGSIIIDDLIDHDSARRGQITFHKEYSSNEAIMFLLFLLGKAVDKLSTHVDVARISNLICAMSEGALRELGLSHRDLFEISKIDEIVKGETIALIKDSLMFGFEVNSSKISDMEEILIRAAKKCAYNFQLLNDLEPFSAAEETLLHKHNQNFDIEKHRKNLVVAKLYERCKPADKERIVNNLKSDQLFSLLLNMIKKYKLKEFIILEVEKSKAEIISDLSGLLPLAKNPSCLYDFLFFVEEMINQCYLRI